jgi:hypothetical protein
MALRLFHIGPGGESSASARKHDSGNGVIAVRCINRVQQSRREVMIKCVQFVRAIERQKPDRTFILLQNKLRHFLSSICDF